jgi:hypothetical protein
VFDAVQPSNTNVDNEPGENWLPDTVQLWLLPQDIKKEEFCQNTLLKHVNLLLDIIAVIITYFTQTGKKTIFLDKNTLAPSNKHLNTITGEYSNNKQGNMIEQFNSILS